jgi:PAS domain S-box-containing protein
VGNEQQDNAEQSSDLHGQKIDLESLPSDVQTIVHELQVRQLELEMQNEELRRTQQKIEAERDIYVDLYDVAPVGYLTISDKGIIQEANLTITSMLGMTRGELIERLFSHFVSPGDQDTYHFHFNTILEAGEPQKCELRLVSNDGAHLWVQVETALVVQQSEFVG